MCYAECAIIEIYVHDDEVRYNLYITLGTKISYLFMFLMSCRKCRAKYEKFHDEICN